MPIQPVRTVRKIEAIQGLRAAAAFSVASLHVLHDAIGLDPGGFAARLHDALPWQAGVDLFFVISGFVMVYSSADLFGQRSGRTVFMTRRVVRIVPLYWAATSLFFLVALMAPSAISHDDLTPARVAMSYAFIPASSSSGLIQPIYSLGWTLNYEMFFYVVFAAFIGQTRTRALLLIGVTLGCLIAVHPLVPRAATALVFWTDPIMAEFLLGVLIGVVAETALSLPDWLRAAGSILAVGALVAGHLAGVALSEPVGVGVPMAVLVAMAVFGRPIPISALLIMTGEASYALYLVHPFAMRGVSIVWRTLHLAGPAAAACYIVISLVLALLSALATHLWFERPVSAWLRTRTARFWLVRSSPPRAAA
ncbi:MAG TPA: acyltransferase [Acetobacteraceae bacterium]|nr:acyltransferase [Acetobacteraceae bacterium]